MVAEVDRIEEFPRDGRLWWVRWVDRYHVPHRGTATPAVDVLLSPLDLGLNELRHVQLDRITAPSDGTLFVRLFTGYVTRLVLGAIFQDGIEVGSLPLLDACFTAEEPQISLRGIRDELHSKPKWRTSPYRVINRGEYALGEFLHSRAVVVESQSAVLVIPCHEIFRTMYAPHSEIALALTSGPWAHTSSQVVHPDWTGLRADRRWQVVLRMRVPNRHVHVVANLCISEEGQTAANGIYTFLQESNGSGHLVAPFPFRFTSLRLKARGLWFDGNPRKFLALQITHIAWPFSEEIVFQRDNSGDKGGTETHVDRDGPYSMMAPLSEAGGGGIAVATEEDPLSASAVTEFQAAAVTWQDLPKLIKAQKTERYKYSDRRYKSEECALERVSPGVRWSGVTTSGIATYSAYKARDPNHRFIDVVEMLDRLEGAGAIAGWAIVEPPKAPLILGSLATWRFPKSTGRSRKGTGFRYLDRSTGRQRGALVCEVRYRNCLVLWLEIEVGQGDGGYKSLIFTVAPQHRDAAIPRLLDAVAYTNGVWPHPDRLVSAAGITTAEPWQHSYIRRARKGAAVRLNEARALAAIARVANPSPPGEYRRQYG